MGKLETEPGLLGEKQVCCLCALPPLIIKAKVLISSVRLGRVDRQILSGRRRLRAGGQLRVDAHEHREEVFPQGGLLHELCSRFFKLLGEANKPPRQSTIARISKFLGHLMMLDVCL